MHTQNSQFFYLIRDCENNYWSGNDWVDQKTEAQKYFEIRAVLSELPKLKQGDTIIKSDGQALEKIVHEIK